MYLFEHLYIYIYIYKYIHTYIYIYIYIYWKFGGANPTGELFRCVRRAVNEFIREKNVTLPVLRCGEAKSGGTPPSDVETLSGGVPGVPGNFVSKANVCFNKMAGTNRDTTVKPVFFR